MSAITVNPFTESTHEMCDSTIRAPVTLADEHETTTATHPPEITGAIGLSESAQNMITVPFGYKSAVANMGQIVGLKFDELKLAIFDGTDKLVDLVAGYTKGKFRGHAISISLPTVFQRDIRRPSIMNDSMWMKLQFESGLGAFWLTVLLNAAERRHQEVASEGARRR